MVAPAIGRPAGPRRRPTIVCGRPYRLVRCGLLVAFQLAVSIACAVALDPFKDPLPATAAPPAPLAPTFAELVAPWLPGRPFEKTTFRSITVDGREVEFSEGFTDLHTRVYEDVLAGRGFGIDDSRPSIELTHRIRTTPAAPAPERLHPMLKAPTT